MSYSAEWDAYYASGRRHQVGLPGYLMDMFVEVSRNVRGQKILELGCGDGNNCFRLCYEGADYYGVDWSEVAIEKAKTENDAGHFACCDFTHEQPFGGGFDFVFDRASMSHNNNDGIAGAIEVALAALKPGGFYIGCDWFSTSHSEFGHGEVLEAHTYNNYRDGQFEGAGTVHFFSEWEIAYLFTRFDFVKIQERIMRRPAVGAFYPYAPKAHFMSPRFDDTEYRTSVWDVIVRKPR